MHVPPAAFLALVAPTSFVLMVLGLGSVDRRSRPTARRPTPAHTDVVLRGESLFLGRVDSWTVGLDCLLAPAGATGPAVPVHLRLRCPLVEWHHAMVLVAATVGRWMATDVPLEVEVTTVAGRCPRARLAHHDASVVLDVENPLSLRALEQQVVERRQGSTVEGGAR